MSEEEKFFAFIEHDGMIELVYWTKTEKEARNKVAEWKREAKKRHTLDEDVHYFVGEILFEPKRTPLSNQLLKDGTPF